MRKQIEGSRAIAEAIAMCRPDVVPAYPITPQTHIVEGLGAMVRSGLLGRCEFITVESEFAAMSAAIGASMAGARTYTATASQGLLYMCEAVFNASGLQAPVVMTVANRAIGAPINIWNDHSDSMSQRDSGWVQLYASDNQAAVGLHVLAFRLAEQLSLPVMVCVDGFVLTHAFEPIDVPSQDAVDAFLPARRARQYLDPDDPVSIGAMVGPEAFTEVRYLAHRTLQRARDVFVELAAEYHAVTGYQLSPLETYRTAGAKTIVLTLGSASGTLHDAIDQCGLPIGAVTLTMYRPFPTEDLTDALSGAEHIIVCERAFSPGADGIVSSEVRAALAGTGIRVSTVVAGLGGRAVTTASLVALLQGADELPDGAVPTFLDLRTDLVEAELRHLDTIAQGS